MSPFPSFLGLSVLVHLVVILWKKISNRPRVPETDVDNIPGL